jgi:thiamine-phosphate pyrophosphorylase
VTQTPTPAGAPARQRLADARLYLCTDARKGRGDFETFLHAALSGGVDIVQLRDKSLDAAEEVELQAVVMRIASEHGALVAVNDRADIAQLAGAQVFHTGQTDLPVASARSLLGRDVVLGRSTNSVELAQAADEDPDVDYFCIGPVWATPTKPGRPAVGVGVVRAVAEMNPATPWFAIGGIDQQTITDVVDAGARRVVVVRAITEAADPREAAAQLARSLRP